MTTYIWQKTNWPQFKFDLHSLNFLLLNYAERVGKISGILSTLTTHEQLEMMVDLLISEAMNTSAIEGEMLNRIDVMSSIKNHLGLNLQKAHIKNKRAEGIAALLVEVRNTFQKPLSKIMLQRWHSLLFPKDIYPHLNSGKWRTHAESMQIISGAAGKIKVHYEAPPSKIVPAEMKQFIKWFNQKNQISMPIVRAAIAHLYFESIHPFEDGNGRIGRAIADKALSQELKTPVMLSLSHVIEANKKKYYNALKTAQRSLDITDWLHYFIQLVIDAQLETESKVTFILKKTQFLDVYKNQLNARQEKVILRMLATANFEGGMNPKKYMSITKTSKATATRDLAELFKMGALTQVKAGRSTRYDLRL